MSLACTTRRGIAGVGLVAAFVACVATAVAANAVGNDDVLHDHRGVRIDFPAPPRRIVSLLPSLTETVCVLGACAALVGTDRFSNWPASVAGLPKLGGLDDAQIEAIVALRPDVVLVAPSARVTERLESLGVRVVVLDSRSRADVRRSLAVLGRMLGVAGVAERTWRDIERDVEAAAARVPPTLRGRRVYFEIDTAPHAAGPSSFIGETLGRLGMANVAAAELGPFPRLNPEHVVRARPDIVMATEDGVADMARRPGWADMPALQQRRVCAFASARFELLVRPGPRLGEAAQAIADCLVSLAAKPRS